MMLMLWCFWQRKEEADEVWAAGAACLLHFCSNEGSLTKLRAQGLALPPVIELLRCSLRCSWYATLRLILALHLSVCSAPSAFRLLALKISTRMCRSEKVHAHLLRLLLQLVCKVPEGAPSAL